MQFISQMRRQVPRDIHQREEFVAFTRLGLCDKLSQFVQRIVFSQPNGNTHVALTAGERIAEVTHRTRLRTVPMSSRTSLSDGDPIAEGALSMDSASARLTLRDRVRQVSRQFEGEIILKALEEHRWNRRRAAEALKISYRSLMYKMKTCNLRDDARWPRGGTT